MKPIQLELDFQGAIAQALAEPEVADIKQLWLVLGMIFGDREL